MSVNLGTAYAELVLKKDKFDKGLNESQEALKTFENKAGLISSGIAGVGGAMEKTGSAMTKSLTLPLLGLGTAAVKTTATFDTSMSKVQALSGATGEEFDILRNKAIEMGSKTAFSASESADALSYMALAGWDTQQMISGLPGVLDLAAASQMDLAEASDMVTDYLTAFGLEAADATNMANEMAYAQANSNTSTRQLGDAFGNCAAQMHTAGQTMETTTAFLEAMANQGMKGSEAGTALSAVMRDITQKMENGAIAIGDTSVQVMDQEGNFRNLIDIMADVEKATDGMGSAEKSAALMQTFTARSIKAVSMSLTEGTDNLYSYESALHNVDGAAGEMADTMLQNLNGQLTILKSTLETLMIQVGDILMPTITQVVGKVKDIVTAFTQMDEEQKKQIMRWAAIVAAIGPALMAFGKVLKIVSALIGTGVKLASWGSKVASAFSIITSGTGAFSGLAAVLGSVASFLGPILAVGAAIGGIVYALKQLYDSGGEFKLYVDYLKTDVLDVINGMVEGIKGSIEKVVGYFKGVWDAVSSIFKNSFDFTMVDSMMGDLMLSISALLERIKEIMPVLMKIGKYVFGTLLAPLIAQLMLVGSTVAGIINGIISALDPLIASIGDVIDIVTDIIDIVTGFFEGIFSGDWSDFTSGIEHLVYDVKALVLDLIDTIGSFIAGFFEGFLGTLDAFTGGLVTKVGQFFINIWNTIVTFFTVTIPQAFNQFVNVTLPAFIESVKEWFAQLPYNLGYALGEALVAIYNWGVSLIEWAKEAIPAFIESVVTWFSEMPGRIKEWFDNVIENIREWGADITEKATTTAKTFVENMVNWFKQLPNKIKEWVSKIPTTIENFKENMKQAGKNIMNSLWDGLKEIWASITKWFEDAWTTVTNFVQGVKDAVSGVTSTNKTSGSHAGGLEYVPYNGYIAQLHEGEKVLTRNEADEYRNGGGSGAVINNFYSPKAIDAYEADKLFRQTMREREEGFV